MNEASGAARAGPFRPQDELFSAMALPLREMFYPLGYSTEILTNDAAVLEAARASFVHTRSWRSAAVLQVRIGVLPGEESPCPSEPIRRQFNHLFTLVADGRNQAVLDLATRANFTWMSRAAAHNAVYFRHNFLEKVVYLLLGASVVTDLHAACVSRNGQGVLLFGDSGAGKSTLAYACARAGWTYTSDDTSYLINDACRPRVIGHAHRARFRPGARELFPELEHFALSPRLEGKPSIEVFTTQLPVPHTAAEADVDFIVYLRRTSRRSAQLHPLPHGAATQRAIQSLYSAGEIRSRHEKILTALAPIPTFELEYQDLAGAIEALNHLTRCG